LLWIKIKFVYICSDEELRDIGTFKERKFIVYESHLKSLLSLCPACAASGEFNEQCRVVLDRMQGSMAVIKRYCPNGHNTEWRTQPEHGTLPFGNIAIAAGVLFSGSSPAKSLNFMRHMNLCSIGYRTYLNIQSYYLIPAVLRVWSTQQETMFCNELKSEALKLGGDGRCCSPGHTAKYGSYSLMDLVRAKVIHFELLQVCIDLFYVNINLGL
jgi:solute carrier family 8 (sodium/calcium exchanger)